MAFSQVADVQRRRITISNRLVNAFARLAQARKYGKCTLPRPAICLEDTTCATSVNSTYTCPDDLGVVLEALKKKLDRHVMGTTLPKDEWELFIDLYALVSNVARSVAVEADDDR